MYLLFLMLLSSASINAQAPTTKNLTQLPASTDPRQPLYDAIHKGDIDTLTTLLKQGADVNTQFRNWETPFYAASYDAPKGKQSIIMKMLIDNGLNPNPTGTDPNPIIIAIDSNKPDIVKMLLSKAQLTSGDLTKFLTRAVSAANVEIVRQLLQLGANPQTIDMDMIGMAPLYPLYTSQGINSLEELVDKVIANVVSVEQQITNRLQQWDKIENYTQKKENNVKK
jgi:ankyrin repeat protein